MYIDMQYITKIVRLLATSELQYPKCSAFLLPVNTKLNTNAILIKAKYLYLTCA